MESSIFDEEDQLFGDEGNITENEDEEKDETKFWDVTRPYIIEFLTRQAKISNDSNIYLKEEDIYNEMCDAQDAYYYKMYLKKLENGETLTEQEQEDYEWCVANNVDPNRSQRKFAQYVYLIVHNLGKSYKFNAYSNNWRAEMMANAIELSFRYALKGFDRNKVSVRKGHEGKKIKAFAYITQIAYNAFIQKIKELKKEASFKDVHELYGGESEAALTEMSGNLQYSRRKNRSKWKEKDEIQVEENTVSAYVTYKNEEGKVLIGIKRGKDVETDLPENQLVLYNRQTEEVIKSSPFKSVFDTINENKEEYPYLPVVYPLNYNFGMDEYSKLQELKLPTLNISRYDNTYVPSFPKREKKEVEEKKEELSFFEQWLNNFEEPTTQEPK